MSTDRSHKRGAVQPLTSLLKRVYDALRTTLDEALAPTALTLPEVAVLSDLSLVPRRSNAQLARANFVTPQTMVTLLKSLESRGLIVRRRSPKGGRALPAELTTEGSKVLIGFRLAMRQVEARILRDLSRTDQEHLSGLLESCLESLRSERPIP